jgi:hypothetical protein
MASNDKPNEWENPEPSALATFLETNDSFKLAVLELRDRPFLDPDETAEAKAPQLLSREEAGKPKLGQRRLANWLRVVLFGLAALCIVGMLVVALEELRIGRGISGGISEAAPCTRNARKDHGPASSACAWAQPGVPWLVFHSCRVLARGYPLL